MEGVLFGLYSPTASSASLLGILGVILQDPIDAVMVLIEDASPEAEPEMHQGRKYEEAIRGSPGQLDGGTLLPVAPAGSGPDQPQDTQPAVAARIPKKMCVR
jgi:hypothetical protein